MLQMYSIVVINFSYFPLFPRLKENRVVFESDEENSQNSVRVRGWFTYSGGGYLDAIHHHLISPTDVEFLDDMCYHSTKFCENMPGILVHNQMPMFKSISKIEENNQTKFNVVSWGSWGEYPMNTLWKVISEEVMRDEVQTTCEVYNIVQVATRLTIHWTRTKLRDKLFKDLALQITLSK